MKRVTGIASPMTLALLLPGCAGMEFGNGANPKGMAFYDPVPHLLVKTATDCVITSEVVALPGKARWVRFRKGYGSADLSANFSGGLITTVGQKTDSKVPETIGAVASLASATGGILKSAVAGAPATPSKTCVPEAKLYRLRADSENLVRVQEDRTVLDYKPKEN